MSARVGGHDSARGTGWGGRGRVPQAREEEMAREPASPNLPSVDAGMAMRLVSGGDGGAVGTSSIDVFLLFLPIQSVLAKLLELL
jgi:hypothetical protein